MNDTVFGGSVSDNQPHRVNKHGMRMSECLQVSLSVYLVEALSRLQDSLPAYFVAYGEGRYSYVDADWTMYFVKDLYYTSFVYPKPDGSGPVEGFTQADL